MTKSLSLRFQGRIWTCEKQEGEWGGGEETVVIEEALFFLKPFISHVGRPAQWGPLLFGRPEGDAAQP